MTPVDTKKLIKRIATEKFRTLGIQQKGQSRLWYFSGNYYLILIEFQPSSWSNGTYLNVGLDFNWYPKDYFAFQFGHRISDFRPSENEKQFESVISELCDLAIEKFSKYREILNNPQAAADKLSKLRVSQDVGWETFDLGLLFALGGHSKKSIARLKSIADATNELDWEMKRAAIARDYIEAIENGTFPQKLEEVIQQTKRLKKIELLEQARR